MGGCSAPASPGIGARSDCDQIGALCIYSRKGPFETNREDHSLHNARLRYCLLPAVLLGISGGMADTRT